MSLFRDERGKVSFSRTALAFTLVFEAVMVWRLGVTVPNSLLSFFDGVNIALISWAGGPKLAENIGKWGGQAIDSVSKALSNRVEKVEKKADDS